MKNKARKLLKYPYIFILAAPIILFAPIILTGKTVFWGTQVTQFVPWWTQALEMLKAGELPLWNPNNGMGAPLLANYQSALLYPPVWGIFVLAYIFGNAYLAWGQAVLIMLHLIWAGLGMARLIRHIGWRKQSQLIAGLAFGMSGYLVARSHFLSINFAIAWLPWVLLATRQLVYTKVPTRGVVKLSIILGFQLLAGHAQSTWYTLLLTIAWFIYWSWEKGGWYLLLQRGKHFVLGVIGAVGIAAVQLLPTAEYLMQSQRSLAVDFDIAMVYSFWPWRLLTLFAPNLFGSPATGDYWGYGAYWEDAIYIGVLPLFLAILAIFSRRKSKQDKRLVRFILLVMILSFLFAFGENTIVFPWLYHNIPTFDMFQAPTRYSIWAVFGLSLLAGMGAKYWRRPTGRGLYWARMGAMGAFAITVGAGLGWWSLESGSVNFGEIRPTFVPAVALMGIWAVMVGILNLTVPITNDDRFSTVWKLSLGIVLSLDLLAVSWGLNPGTSLDLFEDKPRKVVMLGWEAKGSRIYVSAKNERKLKFDKFFSFETFELEEDWTNIIASALPNTNLLNGISSANNFDPLVPGRYDSWMDTLETASPTSRAQMLRLMDVSLIENVEDGEPPEERFDEVEGAKRWRWYSCIISANDGDAALDVLVSKSVNLEEVAVIEAKVGESEKCVATPEVGVVVTNEDVNHLAVQVETAMEGWLVLSDVWYPGWQALVDGEEVDIVRANYLFRGVHLNAGVHVIEYRYRPTSFYEGMFLSVMTLVSLGYIWRRQVE